ncbi:zinc finger, CCHC-type containing protein [Tanacetum coccineum]
MKEDIEGNFEIPCNIGGLKHMNALVDQGSDVNVMPLSTYMKLTDERPAETDIRLSLASHSYIYPLGIADDVLVEVAEHVYPIDFVILDIKENEKRPFILGTPFLTTAKVVIKFDKGTITLRSRKSKITFLTTAEHLDDRNGQDYGPTPNLLKIYANSGWRRRRRHKQMGRRALSSGRRPEFRDGVRDVVRLKEDIESSTWLTKLELDLELAPTCLINSDLEFL